MKYSLLFFAILLTQFSCTSDKIDDSFNAESSTIEQEFIEERMPVNPNGYGVFKSSIQRPENKQKARKLIWTGYLDFQVKNVNESTRKITEMVNKAGGFISELSLNSNTREISNSIKIRIKDANFQDLINSLETESEFTKRLEIKSNDVTEEFIDIESRLKTKREVRDRYIKILNTKTGNVKDIIEAEEAIRKITEEIEAKEGRLRYLKDNVKLSTINLRIYQVVEYVNEPDIYIQTFSEKAIQAMGNGWGIIKGFTLFFLTIWPIWIIIILFVVWKRKWIKRKIEN
jgi:hypothetical protein